MYGIKLSPSNNIDEACPNDETTRLPDNNNIRSPSISPSAVCSFCRGTMASWVTALVPSKTEPCDCQTRPSQAAKKDDDPLTELCRCKFLDCQKNRGGYAPASSEDATPITIVNCYRSDRAREVCTIAQGTPTCIAECELQDVIRSRSRNRDGTTSYQEVLVALSRSLVSRSRDERAMTYPCVSYRRDIALNAIPE